MYIRKDNQYSLADMKMSIESLERCICLHLHKFQYVRTGYSSCSEPSSNTIGYGFKEFSIFVEQGYGMVKKMWITGFPRNDHHKKVFTDLLCDFGYMNLILVDWCACEIVDLRRKEEVQRYLSI
jgi:hypothetical protein